MSMTYIIFVIMQYDVIFIKEKDYDMPTQIAATPIIRGTEAHKDFWKIKKWCKETNTNVWKNG